MDVWLLRHAAAQDRAPSGRDEDRELTTEGLARVEAVGSGLAMLSPPIAAVLTSPVLRARRTAEACARSLGLESPRTFPALLPGTSPSHAAAELARAGWHSALLVGHQPHLGALLGLFLFGEQGKEIPLRKLSIARITWEPGAVGTLEALLPPEVLEELGKVRRAGR
jgi:phosphohistidine phosphatase